MSLFESEREISRRTVLKGIVLGTAGLATAAVLGCDDGKNPKISPVQPTKLDSTPEATPIITKGALPDYLYTYRPYHKSDLVEMFGFTEEDLKRLTPPAEKIPWRKTKEGNFEFEPLYRLTKEEESTLNFRIKRYPLSIDTNSETIRQILDLCESISPQDYIENSTGILDWPYVPSVSQPFHLKHSGIDLDGPDDPGDPGDDYGKLVVSTADGGVVVGSSKSDTGYGNHIVVNHGKGRLTLYAHLSEILAQTGDKVAKGTTIGKIGSSGFSTGTHLHFEIIEKNHHGQCEYINPLLLLSLEKKQS